MKDAFESTTKDSQAAPARERPDPASVHAAGITTKETLDWQAAKEPPVPRPEPSPDDPAGWRSAIARADAEHAARIQEMRERFAAKGEKAQLDFKTAHDFVDRER